MEAVDGETGAGSGAGAGAGAGARIGVVDDILKTKESEFMPDFLSEEVPVAHYALTCRSLCTPLSLTMCDMPSTPLFLDMPIPTLLVIYTTCKVITLNLTITFSELSQSTAAFRDRFGLGVLVSKTYGGWAVSKWL